MFNAKVLVGLVAGVLLLTGASASAAEVSGLILKIRTEHENLDRGTEVLATVWADGEIVAKNVVVAKGEVAEDTDHPDAPIEFTKNVSDTAKFKIELNHPGIKNNSDPHWRMTFSAKAVMTDKTKRSTTLDMKDSKIYETKGRKHLNFEGGNRSSGEMPFKVE
jgi:hypothetical protein